MLVAGCDVGSLTAEAVVMDNGSILGAEIIRVRPRAELSARDVMNKLLDRLGISFDDIVFCVSTGYGRETISFADDNLSESRATVMGRTGWCLRSARSSMWEGRTARLSAWTRRDGSLIS